MQVSQISLDDVEVLAVSEEGGPQTAPAAGRQVRRLRRRPRGRRRREARPRAPRHSRRYLPPHPRGAPEEIYPRIGSTLDDLARQAVPDHSRPWLELYRRYDEVGVLLPVAR